MPKWKQQAGFTLIESMIGISLGIVILGGVLAVYIPTLQTWRTTAAVSSLQDVEQIAHELLSNSIRQSGLLVCGENNNLANGIQTSGGATVPHSASITKWAFEFTQPFLAVGATDSSTVSSQIEGSGEINTERLGQDGEIVNLTNAGTAVGDVFYTLVPGGESMRIISNNNSGTQSMVLSGASDLQPGELYLVHDCDFPVVIRGESGTTGSTINYHSTYHTARNYPAQTVVSRFNPTLYYIGVHNNAPTLYKRVIGKTLSGGSLTHLDTPVITGIENMRIEYGVDRPSAVSEAPNPTIVTHYYTVQEMEAQRTTISTPIPDIYDYALVARLSLMIRTDQENSNNLQQELKFPALDGSLYNCYSETTDPTACPAFLANTRDRVHKVATFSFNLSKKHIVIN